MPRTPRRILPGIAYHITQRGTNRQTVFFRDADHAAYLRLLGENLAEAQVRLLAWCQMTNHVHLIAVPAHEDSLAILFRRTHGRYAQMINAQRNRSGHLWQNRHFGCPLSESHLYRALAYVELNPVRAGIVREPDRYQWSSAQVHLGLSPGRYRLLDLDFWRDQGAAEAWRSLFATPADPVEIRQLRRCTFAGRPYGDEDFLARFEQLFQRRFRRLKPAAQTA
jgi:putative transposase